MATSLWPMTRMRRSSMSDFFSRHPAIAAAVAIALLVLVPFGNLL